jgi:phosphinothricin acetyltransferase
VSGEAPPRIRPAAPGDLAALTRIYNHYIERSPATFDLEPYSPEARAAWLEGFAPRGRHRCFVAEADAAGCVGYASSGRFRPKAAYDPCVETSVYLDAAWTGRGLGAELYAALFDALAGEDVHRAVAGITLPNPASVALHRRFGFREVGVFEEVGRKQGRWWSVLWMQKAL